MNPILKVLIVTSLFCFGLFFVASEFPGKTKGLNDSLDVMSLAYIRDEDTEEDPRPDMKLDSQLNQALGIREPPPPVRAVEVALEIPSECDASDIVLAPLSVEYRHESPTIKGSSLSGLELLVAEYRKCDGGVFHLSHNPLGKEDSTTALMQRRLDELKYSLSSTQSAESGIEIPRNS